MQLLQQAAEDYSDGQSEAGLQRLSTGPGKFDGSGFPVSLFFTSTVIRGPGYQSKAREVVRQKLGLPQDWSTLSEAQLAEGQLKTTWCWSDSIYSV